MKKKLYSSQNKFFLREGSHILVKVEFYIPLVIDKCNDAHGLVFGTYRGTKIRVKSICKLDEYDVHSYMNPHRCLGSYVKQIDDSSLDNLLHSPVKLTEVNGFRGMILVVKEKQSRVFLLNKENVYVEYTRG